MADNVTLPGTGVVVAADDVSDVQFQKIKVDLGGDGATSPLVRGQQAKADSIPVTLASDEDAIAVTDNGGSLTVDGTVAVSGTVAVTDNSGSLTVDGTVALGAGSASVGTLGANSGVDIGDVTINNASGGAAVNIQDGGNSITVDGTVAVSGTVAVTDNSGSLTVDGTVAVSSLPASTNTIEVVGDAAHDAAVAGNPVLIGVEARSTQPTAVGSGDVVRLQADLNGKQVVAPYTIPELIVSNSGTAITGTTAQEQLAAGGSGIRNYITAIMVTNSHATTGTLVEIRDGTSTVLWRGYAAPVGGGFAVSFPTPLRGTANTAVNAYNITNSSNTYVNVAGYRAP